jgi:hypothetical protein
VIRSRTVGRLAVGLVAAVGFFGTAGIYARAASGTPVFGAPRPVVTITATTPPSPSPSVSPSPTQSPNPCQPPPPVSQPSDEFGASPVQDSIENVGIRIMDLVDQNGYPGFTGLISDPDNARLVVCWLNADPFPQPIADIVNNPGEPITVVRQDSPFSNADLTGRVDTILGDPGLGAQINGDIHAVTVPEEGTGLIAGVQPNDPNTFDLAGAEAALTAAAGVPVTIEVEPRDTPTTRLNDASPWFGGARLNNVCSSGFGIVQPPNRQLLLTAAHCFAVGAAVRNGVPVANLIGNVALRFPGVDSEAIQIAGGGLAGGSVYTGGVNDVTEGSVRINRVGLSLVNQFVATSGSFSGENRLLRVIRTGRFENVGLPGGAVVRVGPTSTAVATVPKLGVFVAVASGDSGGPVIRRLAGAGGIAGQGTIVAGGGVNFACVVYDARNCFTRVIYNSLRILLVRVYGAALA